MMATFMAAVENTIVGTAMPSIVGSLGDFHLFSWVFVAYLLFQAVSVPIYGRLSDLYGRRNVFFAGAGIFLIGSTLCGFAHDMYWLIAFRALQGMGAGAVQPVAYAIVGDVYTPTERAKVQGYLSSVFGISAVIGPTLGAYLVQHASWSAVFWVNLPIGAIAMAMLGAFLREQPQHKPPSVDIVASLLLTVGAGALMLAMIQAAQIPLWLLVTCTVIGIAALWALVRHERHAPAPMLPIRFWTNKVIALGNFGSFAIGAVMMSVTGFLPTYLQGVMGRGASAVGAVVAAMSISWAVASVGAGRLMLRSSYRASAMLGGAMLALGSLVLVVMTPHSGLAWPVFGALLVGLGMGSCNTTYLVSVQAAAALRERGAATASNMFMRIVGQSTGAALFGALLNAGLAHYAPDAPHVADQLMEPGLRQALGVEQISSLITAMALSLRNVYFVAAIGGLIVLFLGWRLPARLSPRLSE
ncbi:MAG: MFS transporter [Reyranella sp.]|uniref:MDR family MFS transporter n=1 Tax=Reyranella sp. TaxID=1929291 RepID=UPI001ACE6D28|nr:MDR family MFS transporter [Reyranella sp.]MBN9089673.1 MFS transporter [Reyranella sp.]